MRKTLHQITHIMVSGLLICNCITVILVQIFPNWWKHVENGSNLYKLFHIFFKLVQTCSYLFKLVQIGSDLFKHVEIVSNLFILVQTCSNCFRLVKICPNWLKFVKNGSKLSKFVQISPTLFLFNRSVVLKYIPHKEEVTLNIRYDFSAKYKHWQIKTPAFAYHSSSLVLDVHLLELFRNILPK